MRAITREWVQKAEGDYSTALRELRARKSPNYDACCFHAQQCVEKYFKARLQESLVPFAKTHDLGALLQAVLPMEPAWAILQPDVQKLARYAVEVRYPGLRASKAMASDSCRICRVVRAAVRLNLKLPAK